MDSQRASHGNTRDTIKGKAVVDCIGRYIIGDVYSLGIRVYIRSESVIHVNHYMGAWHWNLSGPGAALREAFLGRNGQLFISRAVRHK